MKVFKLGIISLLVLCISYIIYDKVITSPTRIFNKSLNSVVELRSKYDEESFAYGTAVFIEDDILVSNAHTVTYKENGQYTKFAAVEIRFAFEDYYREVEVVKFDNDKDLSILKLIDNDSSKGKSITFSNSNKIKSGDEVYAIGNGLNHGINISSGLVSLPRVNIIFDQLERKVIRCDLTINEGNSGGALIDKLGNLIGITTFRLKDSSGIVIQGVAFCIPIEEVIKYYKL